MQWGNLNYSTIEGTYHSWNPAILRKCLKPIGQNNNPRGIRVRLPITVDSKWTEERRKDSSHHLLRWRIKVTGIACIWQCATVDHMRQADMGWVFPELNDSSRLHHVNCTPKFNQMLVMKYENKVPLSFYSAIQTAKRNQTNWGKIMICFWSENAQVH